jgi:tocopherol O-methyltransferase
MWLMGRFAPDFKTIPDFRRDRAWAIESSGHIADKARYFSEALPRYPRGGGLAVCIWLAGRGPEMPC